MTGASGFIGGHVVDALLSQGHEVQAVARHAGMARQAVTWHEADLLDPGAHEALTGAAQATHLIHLAWHVAPGSFWSAPENERWIDASLRLLRAFGEAGGRRVVMAGTCAEYRWDGEVSSERHTPLAPTTLYGACKHATHVAAAVMAEQLGLALAWGRVFFLYGPGEHSDRLVASVVRGLLAGHEVPTTEGHQRRDFMHVSDVARAFVALLDSQVTGAVNIASGLAIPVRELIMLIARTVGEPARVRFGELPPRSGEPELIAGETARLTDEVGFRPTIGLREGIGETVAWWRAGDGAT